jgi:hypothetical protein
MNQIENIQTATPEGLGQPAEVLSPPSFEGAGIPHESSVDQEVKTPLTTIPQTPISQIEPVMERPSLKSYGFPISEDSLVARKKRELYPED